MGSASLTHPTALFGTHVLGGLLLGEAGVGAGADQYCGEGKFLRKRRVFVPVGRVVHPAGMQFVHASHDSTCLAGLDKAGIKASAVLKNAGQQPR